MKQTHFNAEGFTALIAKDSRRRSEEAVAAGLDEATGLLLPLALALSRFAARKSIAEDAQ